MQEISRNKISWQKISLVRCTEQKKTGAKRLLNLPQRTGLNYFRLVQ